MTPELPMTWPASVRCTGWLGRFRETPKKNLKISQNSSCVNVARGYIASMTTNTADITTGMSQLLKALGFDAMAENVIGETDGERLGKYARVIIRNSPQANKARLLALFRSQNIYPAL